jgi:glycosyltransferase involved in cell wall biosynthesis
MISVALASYNGAQYLRAQVESILPQLGSDDELVVSDDASTDETLSVLRDIADPRIRIHEHANRVGYVRNFERAIRECRGDFVFFSDQDDVWLPGKVDTLTSCLQRVGCAVSDAQVVNEALGLIHPSYFGLRRVRSFSALYIFLFPPIVGATIACRRDFLESVLPFPGEVPHDFWITLNAVLRRQFEVVREPLLLYRRHGAVASLSASRRKRSPMRIARERWAVLRALWRQRARQGDPRQSAA